MPLEEVTYQMAKKLDKIKEKLLERRNELLTRIQELTSVPTQSVSGDKVDQAIASLEREDTSMHLQVEISELHDIQDALKRIERGEYGKCESCGKRIGAARLEALPYAMLCLQCKQMEENESEAFQTRARWEIPEETTIEEGEEEEAD